MAETSVSPEPQKLTLTHWLILIMAAIGFAFDTYELLMLPLLLPGALRELLPSALPGTPDFNRWRSLMFWVPAMAGGTFGLLGGYLTDLLGRRRILTWSILLYAVSACLAGYATSLPMLLLFRSTKFIGVCVEFVAAVAWLAELFPNHNQRERVLGYTQAFSSIGGLLVAASFKFITSMASELPQIYMPEFLHPMLGEIQGTQQPWRYMLISGLIPAIPLIVIRPFLPESPIWAQRKAAGTLKRPSFAVLFQPRFLRTTLVTTLMVGLSYATAFGAIQQMPQFVGAVPQAKEAVTAALAEPKTQAKLAALPPEKAEAARSKLTRDTLDPFATSYTFWQEIGGLAGRFTLAFLAVMIVSRRSLIRVFLIPGLVIAPLVFGYCAPSNQSFVSIMGYDVTLLHVGMFLAGFFTVAQFSFWGNYLPIAYPVHLRGTGESVAANVGGRMFGTSFAAIASQASIYFPGDSDALRMAYTSATIALSVYFLALVLSFFLPETSEALVQE